MATRVNETEHPFAGVCNRWLALIKEAKRSKEDRFGKYAREAYKFYNGPHDWMWQREYSHGTDGFLNGSGVHLPYFKMTVNRPFEAVAMFGPVLFHQYPEVTVTPQFRAQLDPQLMMMLAGSEQAGMQAVMAEQQDVYVRDTAARLKQHYLTWVQTESNKKGHSRKAITEAIVKGLGLTFTELHRPRGSQMSYPRSRHVSCDQYVKDPDANYAEDVQWIAIEWQQPVNLVERKFGLPDGSLTGTTQSKESGTTAIGRREAKSRRTNAGTHDLIRYYEIYSKNGFGQRIKATNKTAVKSKFDFDFLGDYVRIVVAEGVPYPLNLPSWVLSGGPEMMFEMAQWPVPFWMDDGLSGGWPVSELGFWHDTDDVWPISLFKPVIGELRFINWAMSFLADKVASSSHEYVAVMKAAAEDIREQITNKTGPYTIIELEQLFGNKINDVVSFLQAPTFTSDIWRMVAEMHQQVDKRTGLTELMYGLTGAQMRSATEANVRQENVNIRPQDMANTVEDWLSEMAMKECEAAVWLLDREDYEPVLGPAAASFWEQYVATQDFESVVRDYSYKIAAGTARRPNREGKQRALNDFAQVAMPVLQQFAMQGVVEPWNALVADMAEVMQIDGSRYQVELPPAQPDMEQAETEDEHQQDMRITAEKAALDMDIDREKADVAISIAQEKAAADIALKNQQRRSFA